MQHFFLILHDDLAEKTAIVNKIIIQTSSDHIYYYPDLLIRHPFDERTLSLDSSNPLTASVIHAFDLLSPHQISILIAPKNCSHASAKAIKAYYNTFLQCQTSPFFTENELQAIDASVLRLRLTQNQQILFRKAAAACKWKHPDKLLSILDALPAVSVKKERNQYFNDFITYIME